MELSRRSFLFFGAAAGTGAIIHSLIPKPVIFDMGRIVPATFDDVVKYTIGKEIDLGPYMDNSIAKVLSYYGVKIAEEIDKESLWFSTLSKSQLS